MQDFTTGSLPRHIVRMAIPMFFGMIFQTLYVLVDLYFVAQLGESAVAGVSAAGNVQFIVMAFTQVLSVGTMAPIAQAVGRRDAADANRLFHQSLVLALACLGATLVVGYAFAGTYAARFGADAATATAARRYLLAYLPGMAMQFPLFVVGAALRGTGVNRPTMIVQMASVLVNAALAPVLIAGWGTGRPLGVVGAGLASTLAIGVSALFTVWYFGRLESVLTFDRALFRPVWREARRILSVGLPAGGETGLMFVYSALIYLIIRDLGAASQAGFGIGSRVMQSLFIPAMAIAFAVAPIAGQNIGAGRLGRARETFMTGVSIEAGCMLVLSLIAKWQGATMVGIFTTDPAVTAVAVDFLTMISWNFVAQGVIFTAAGMFQAMGNTLPSLAASATRLVTFAVPGLWLARQPGFHLHQLWQLSIATVTLQAVVSLGLLSRAWRRRTSIAMAVPAPA